MRERDEGTEGEEGDECVEWQRSSEFKTVRQTCWRRIDCAAFSLT